MILTNKAKDDFDEFLYDKYGGIVLKEEQVIYLGHYAREVTLWDVFEKLPLYLQQETIIQWLDSVGIHIETGVYPDDLGNVEFSGSFFGNLGGWDDDTTYKNRQEATKSVIEYANKLYNKTKQNKTKQKINENIHRTYAGLCRSYIPIRGYNKQPKP